MDLFFAEHALTHAPAVAQPDGSTDDPFVRGLGVEQLRLRPAGLNSVAWNLFHVARTEDVAFNLLIGGQAQLLDEEDWLPGLNLRCRDNGAGMNGDEVSDLTARVDLAALRAYRLAVGRRTRAVAAALTRDELAEPVPMARVEESIAQGVVNPRIPRAAIERSWGNRTKGWFLFLGAGHNLWHYGEVQTIRSLIERGGAAG